MISLKSVERFNPITNTWTFVTPMPDIRMSFSACVLDGKIFVMGGFDGFCSYRTVWIYHHSINKWHPLSIQLPSHITASHAIVIDNLPNAIDYTYYGRCIFDANNGDDNVQPKISTHTNQLWLSKRNYFRYLLFKLIPNNILLKCKYFYVQNQHYFINYLFMKANKFSRQQKQYLQSYYQHQSIAENPNSKLPLINIVKDKKELNRKIKCKKIHLKLNRNLIVTRTRKNQCQISNNTKLTPEMKCQIMKYCAKCKYLFKDSGTIINGQEQFYQIK